MTLDQPADPDLDIELVAASLRADAADLGAFVEALAAKLEEALPNGVRVQRSGRLGGRRVRRIAVDAGDERLELRRDGAHVETLVARMSGGIVLNSRRVDADAWLRALGRTLAEQARRSAVTRQALDRLLNG